MDIKITNIVVFAPTVYTIALIKDTAQNIKTIIPKITLNTFSHLSTATPPLNL